MSVGARTERLDLIACDGCARRFATYDGPSMIASITGPCPDCGGRFRLVDRPGDKAAAAEATDGISSDMALLYLGAFGHRPTRVRTYIQPEFAVCVLGEILASAERSELDRGRTAGVEAARRRILAALDPKLVAIVGDRAGRPVLSHLARVNVEAEITVHFFLFEDSSAPSDAGRQ